MTSVILLARGEWNDWPFEEEQKSAVSREAETDRSAFVRMKHQGFHFIVIIFQRLQKSAILDVLYNKLVL